MRLRIQSSVILLALAVCAGAVQARDGTTATQLGLHAAPSANTELLLTMPAGSQVSVGGCSRGWCKVVWNSYSGYASESGLAINAASRQAPVRGAMNEPEGEIWPIYPPYPYRSGYYPKADWYHDMPPYVALDPSFHRRRYFMMAQERNRYRYMPHIFHGYSDDGDSYAK
jgi:Bacterial SH3 domain